MLHKIKMAVILHMVHYLCSGMRVIFMALEGHLIHPNYIMLEYTDETQLIIISCRSYKNSTIMP